MKSPVKPHAMPVALALLVLAVTARAQDGYIAVMDVDGSNAFIENARQRPSAVDVPIQDGNMVRTGSRTSARIELAPQGTVLLNQNSAKLITLSFFKGTRCLAVRLISGELFINGENVCFLTNVGAVSGISRSLINVKVDARGTVVTVLQGTAEFDAKPAAIRVTTSEQLSVLPNGEYRTTRLDPAEAQRAADWTRQFFVAQPKPKMSGLKKALIAIGAALAIGAVVHEANDDDDDRRDPPPPPPPTPAGSDYPVPADSASPTPTPGDTTKTSTPAASTLQRQRALELQLSTCCVPFSGGGEQTIRTTPADCSARGGRLSDACSAPVR